MALTLQTFQLCLTLLFLPECATRFLWSISPLQSHPLLPLITDTYYSRPLQLLLCHCLLLKHVPLPFSLLSSTGFLPAPSYCSSLHTPPSQQFLVPSALSHTCDPHNLQLNSSSSHWFSCSTPVIAACQGMLFLLPLIFSFTAVVPHSDISALPLGSLTLGSINSRARAPQTSPARWWLFPL